tara:strand:+ start:10 stop:384 length:375 start_codon:yes stop_codon:yes gene_type:complete
MDCFLFGQCCQTIEADMSDYNWCHGPRCHERATTTRVRGVKGSKVLRTMKVPYHSHCAEHYRPYIYFCDQTCMHDFITKHIDEFVQLHPRPEALETPIEVTKETNESPYWGKQTRTIIRAIDNA